MRAKNTLLVFAGISLLCGGAILYYSTTLKEPSSATPLSDETLQLKERTIRSPWDVELRHRLGALYLHQGDLANAEKELLEAINLAPTNSRVLQSIGMLYYRKGERHKALGYWRTLLEIEPGNRFIWDLVSRLSNSDGNAKEPHGRNGGVSSEWEFNYRLGQESYEKQDYKKAAEYFEKALEINPSDFRTHFNLGAAYYVMKDLQKAKKSWETALKHKKEDFMTMKLIGLADKGIDRHRWMEDLREQIRKMPGNWKPHYDLAGAYMKDAKTFEEAEREFLEVIRLDPENADAFSRLIGLCQQMDDHEKAIRYAELFVEKMPGNLEAKRRLDTLLSYKNIIENGKMAWKKNGAEAYDEMVEVNNSRSVFYVDKYEVTRSSYQEFLKSTGRQPPLGWKDSAVKDKENHPVTGVTWYDATVYCRWKDKRLPTDEEWIIAAWGESKTHYPWGGEFDPGKACTAETGFDKPVPAGSNMAHNGIHDLVGNVMEWTSGSNGNLMIKKGGAFNTESKDISSGSRWEAPPAQYDEFTGFRCVKDIN